MLDVDSTLTLSHILHRIKEVTVLVITIKVKNSYEGKQDVFEQKHCEPIHLYIVSGIQRHLTHPATSVTLGTAFVAGVFLHSWSNNPKL